MKLLDCFGIGNRQGLINTRCVSLQFAAFGNPKIQSVKFVSFRAMHSCSFGNAANWVHCLPDILLSRQLNEHL